MGNETRVRLGESGRRDRTGEREPVAIHATCRIGERDDEDVLITDLGRTGCKIHTGAVGVTKVETLVLTLDGCAPIHGSLQWIKGGMLGVHFDQPLGDALLERLCSQPPEPEANVVPLRS